MSTVIITQSSLSRGRCVSGIWHDPPVGGDLGLIPELPGGYSLYLAHTGSPVQPSGWNTNGNENLTVVQDGTAPRSPSDVLRCTYPNGFAAGGEPMKLWFAASGTGLFVTYWMKYDSAFEGHSTSGVNKHIFSIMTDSDWLVMSRFYGNVSTMTIEGNLQIPGWEGGAYIVGGVTSVSKDEWCRISWETLSSGEASLWVNGILQETKTGIPWNSFPGEFQIAPTWGGVGGTVPYDQYLYFDEVLVYTK